MVRKLILEQALAFLLGLFVFAVLIRGGNTRQVIICASAMALVCLALSAVIAWRSSTKVQLSLGSGLYVLAMLCLLASAVMALVPLPLDVWLSMSGRSAYEDVVATLRQEPFEVSSLQLSIDPIGTSFATLSLIVAFAVGLATLLLPASMLLKLLGTVVSLAVAEAALGILQLAFGTPSFMGYDVAVGGTRATGTFINKNHYATLLAMALPLLVFRATGQYSFFRQNGVPSSLSNVWWGTATALVLVALIASLSRAGGAAGFSVAVLATLLCIFRKQATTSQRLGPMIIAALALAMASGSSLKLFLDSLQGAAFAESADGRRVLFHLSLAGVKAFFPLGSGLGSYSIAFQRFQPEEVAGYVEHVHNDYVELLFEAGILGALALACFAMAAAAAGLRLWKTLDIRQQPLSPAIACWLGAAAFAIHAWFDFPAHIPGLIIVVSLLFGACMNESLLKSHDRSHRKPPTLDVSTVAGQIGTV